MKITARQIRITFAPACKPYQIGLLFTNKSGDFGAISVTEQSRATPISKVESDIWDSCSHKIPDSFSHNTR